MVLIAPSSASVETEDGTPELEVLFVEELSVGEMLEFC